MKKSWQFLSLVVLVLALAGGTLFSQSKPKSRVRWFSPGSLYIYILGSFNRFTPPDVHSLWLGYGNSEAFAPVFGIGYRVVNFGDKFFINLEGEYSPASYDFSGYTRDQKISVLSVMINAEGNISRRVPVILFGGIGIGSHHLSDLKYEDYWGDIVTLGDDNILVMALDIGVKFPISKRLLIRAEYQWNGEVYNDFDDYWDYWDDEWDNTRWDFLSSSVSIGIEFHF